MDNPQDYKYTKEHQWVAIKGDTAIIGITDYAQSELGEIVFIELPSVGDSIKKDAVLCVAESTKTASDVHVPISGDIVEVNEELEDNPSLINKDPYKSGWIIKIANFSKSEFESLMSTSEYQAYIAH
ncbi:MAG: glycine cleavage system protein GcvH [Bdellovibrionota bacterium]